MPGSMLTGHTDAVEHEIDTGDSIPICCTPRRMSRVIDRSHCRRKQAFARHSGLFQFKVMPFGLSNAPATFERLMDRVLQGLRWSRCLDYLDDIISFGSTFDGALDNLTLIFERLQAYGLQLKSTKCHLFQCRRCPFCDILLVGVAWNASQERLRTSNHGRFRIVLRVVASSLVLLVITDDLYLILLTWRHP